MEQLYSKGDRIIFTWIEMNYWTERGADKATPHPQENRAPGHFHSYLGKKSALVDLDPRRGGPPIRRSVRLVDIKPECPK